MKYIITEQQNKRIMTMIKEVGEEFSDERVVRTELDVHYNPRHNLFLILPTFYVDNKSSFPYSLYRHMLAQRIEDYVGVSVHAFDAIIEEI